MPPPLRTIVAASDRRILRALARLLAGERALRLCGFAQDAQTAAEIARALRAPLVLLDARLAPLPRTQWPGRVRRIVLHEDGEAPAARADELCLPTARLAADLPRALARLFPQRGRRPAASR